MVINRFPLVSLLVGYYLSEIDYQLDFNFQRLLFRGIE